MKIVFLSVDANAILFDYMKKIGNIVLKVSKTPFVYSAISSHPDISLCPICKTVFITPSFLHDSTNQNVVRQLNELKIPFIIGDTALGPMYPQTIPYNALHLNTYFIHNLRFTDPGLLSFAEHQGLTLVNVKQGYTKCNTLVIDDHSIITSDESICKALLRLGMDVLFISSGHVALPPYPYGFLGGASGKVGDTIIFNGDLSAHPDFKNITHFIEKKGKDIVYFKDYPLSDIGSILTLS